MDNHFCACRHTKLFRFVLVMIGSILLFGLVIFAVLYLGKLGPFEMPQIYTALGDSISAGYGLPSNKDGSEDGTFPEGTFARQFRDYLGASEAYDFSVSGQDTNDLLAVIGNENHDEYPALKDAISKSDVITLALGSNDILGPAMDIICDYFGVSTSDEVPEKVAGVDFWELLQDFVSLSDVFRSYDFTPYIEQYSVNLTKIMDILTSWNENATILVVGFYNPFQSLMTSKIFLQTVDLADTAQLQINALNEKLMAHAYCGKKFIPVALVETSGGEVLHEMTDDMINCHVDFSSMANTNVDPHPSQTGHNYIFSRLVEEYEKNNSFYQSKG